MSINLGSPGGRAIATIVALVLAFIAAVVARGEEGKPALFRSPQQAMLHNMYTNSATIVKFERDSRGRISAEVDLEPGFCYMLLHERSLAERWTTLYSRCFVTWNGGTAGGYVMRVMEPERRVISIPSSRFQTGFYRLVRAQYAIEE